MSTPPYNVSVQAYSSGGNSAGGVSESSEPVFSLATPTNVTVIKIGTSVKVSWDYTPDTDDSVSGFKVLISNGTALDWGSAVDVGLNNMTESPPTLSFYYQAYNALVGTVYATVQAYNANGDTSNSSSALMLVVATLPSSVYIDGISTSVNRICSGLEASTIGSSSTVLKLNGVNIPLVTDIQAGTNATVSVSGRTVTISGGSPLTAKGDVYVHNGTTNTRLPVGTNGYSLVADSTQSTGLKWSLIPSGDAVLSATQSFTGTNTFNNINLNMTGSSYASPRTIGFANFVDGQGYRLFGAFQSGWGRAFQIYNYWGLYIGGNTQSVTDPAMLVGAATDPSVTIYGTTASACVLRVRGAASQSGSLQEWTNSSNTVLSRITSSGNMAIGSATTPRYVLSVGDDIGDIASGFTGKTLCIGSTGSGTLFTLGQDATHGLQFRWDYNATAGNATANLVTWGYNNPLYIDASNVFIQNNNTAGSITMGATTVTMSGGTLVMSNGTKNYIQMGTVSPNSDPANNHLGMRIKVYGSNSAFAQSTDCVIGTSFGGIVQWYSAPSSHQFWINGTRRINVTSNGTSVNGRLGVGSGVVDPPTSGAYIQSPDAYFTSASSGSIPITVKAASGQTGNLTEWRNSSNSVITSITSAGSISTSSSIYASGQGTFDGGVGTGNLFVTDGTGTTNIYYDAFTDGGTINFTDDINGTPNLKTAGAIMGSSIVGTGIYGTAAGANYLTQYVSYIVLNTSLGNTTVYLPTAAPIGTIIFASVINRDTTNTNTLTFDAQSGNNIHGLGTFAQSVALTGTQSNQFHRWFRIIKMSSTAWSIDTGLSDI